MARQLGLKWRPAVRSLRCTPTLHPRSNPRRTFLIWTGARLKKIVTSAAFSNTSTLLVLINMVFMCLPYADMPQVGRACDPHACTCMRSCASVPACACVHVLMYSGVHEDVHVHVPSDAG